MTGTVPVRRPLDLRRTIGLGLTERVIVRFTAVDVMRLNDLSARRRVSVSDLIREATRRALDKG